MSEYCYHCAFVTYTSGTALSTSDARQAINQFTAMVGKGLYSYNLAGSLNWNESLWMTKPGDHDYKPLIDEGLFAVLTFAILPYARGNLNDTQTLRDIGAGLHDTYIRSIANQAKTFARPIHLKLGIEFNICQGGGRPAWASYPADFVVAWRRIVDLFREQGASNVQFIWNPNWNDIGPHHWTEYYPGDDYVDLVGIDLYQFQPTSDPEAMIAGVYNDYATRKPIAISEWGTNWTGQNYSDASRAVFINAFFDAVERRPAVKMISYHYYVEFRFDPVTLPLTTEAYNLRIANPRYVVATPTASLLPLVLCLLGLFGIIWVITR